MPIRLKIVVDKDVARIRTDWDNVTDKTIRNFCKLLANLQNGQCGTELIDAIQNNPDKKTSKKIINQLSKFDNFLDMPVLTAKEVGQIYSEEGYE